MIEHRSHIYGVVGEFENEHQLIHAAEKAREAGYRRIEGYAPFPVEGLSEALGLKRNTVPLITLIGGLCGGLAGGLHGGRRVFQKETSVRVRFADPQIQLIVTLSEGIEKLRGFNYRGDLCHSAPLHALLDA